MVDERGGAGELAAATPKETFDTTIYRLSYEAFALAQQVATQQGDSAALLARAREINDELEELLPQLQSGQSADMGLPAAWADARLDVGWVLAGGDMSSSTRLHYFLEVQKRNAGGAGETL